MCTQVSALVDRFLDANAARRMPHADACNHSGAHAIVEGTTTSENKGLSSSLCLCSAGQPRHGQLTKVCGFERKSGQTKLLAHFLARCKPPGGRRGWPISYGLCCMGSLNCAHRGLLQSFLCCIRCWLGYKIFLHAQKSAPVSVTVQPAEGAPFIVHRLPLTAQGNPALNS
eukprot:364283-Chlamydomonas_euryale.AAC.31